MKGKVARLALNLSVANSSTGRAAYYQILPVEAGNEANLAANRGGTAKFRLSQPRAEVRSVGSETPENPDKADPVVVVVVSSESPRRRLPIFSLDKSQGNTAVSSR